MRTFLLAATILAPFAVAPAFAGSLIVAGDVNLAQTSANSNADVSSGQNTTAAAKVGGNGAVIVGAVSGNYTQVNTGAGATAGPKGSFTTTNAQQVNIGGTVTGGLADNGKHGNGASGTASGSQNSTANGGAGATASKANLGGSITVQQPKTNGIPANRTNRAGASGQ